MPSDDRMSTRILGSLRSAGGKGVVRMEDRIAAGIADVWAALTDPARLRHWYGEIEGDLRVGGEYRARLFASGWDGTGRIEACDPPGRLLVTSSEPDQPDVHATEVWLTAEGEHTTLVVEERGMPLDYLAAYGAGVQIHVEDLEAYLAGRERCDAGARWGELQPAYEVLAVSVG